MLLTTAAATHPHHNPLTVVPGVHLFPKLTNPHPLQVLQSLHHWDSIGSSSRAHLFIQPILSTAMKSDCQQHHTMHIPFERFLVTSPTYVLKHSSALMQSCMLHKTNVICLSCCCHSVGFQAYCSWP